MKHNFGRKSIAGFTFCILTTVMIFPSITGNPLRYENRGRNESLSYSFSFASPSLSTARAVDTTFTHINIPGCVGLGNQPGDPTLPVKFIQLVLPPMEAVDSVIVTGSPIELHPLGVDLNSDPVFPAQQEVPLGSTSHPGFVMNQEVYSSHERYPALPSGEYHVGYTHGYAILDITLEPVQLIPAEGRIFYYPELTVTISLHQDGYVNPFFRGTPEDEAWVKSLVSNPDITARYAGLPTFSYPGGLCDPSDHFDYVIITTTQNSLDHWDITQETPYNWESLMDHHVAEGLACTLVTVQDINACPDYWNTSDPLFNDSQAHIREFCKDAYEDWGTSYILVAGDADTIPARQLYYDYEGNVDSDLYWSNLDNSFNADHDNQWGEEGDSGFDPYSEVFIGRVPCDTPQDVSNWLTKSFYYANASNPDYLENGGFFEASLGWDGRGGMIIDFAAINGTDHWYGSDPGQWPSFLGFLYGFATWNAIHPDDAFNLSVRWTGSYPPNPNWTYAENPAVGFRNAINNDSVTLITGIGHADSQMSLDVYTSDWQTLYHNTKPFFIIDLGCHCGDFDDGDDGVLDTMLFNSNPSLAFGCLFATGYTWGGFESTNSSDILQTKLFWDYFFDLANNSQSTANWQLGKGLAWSKDIMAPTLNWSYPVSSWRGAIEDRLLFADPAQRLKHPYSNSPPNKPTITWSSDVGLTVSAIDPDGDDVFYMIDWGDGVTSEWSGPYHSGVAVAFAHIWTIPGTYWVKARAMDILNAVSEWSDPIPVVVPDVKISIESIHGIFGIAAIINNTGSENVSTIHWSIDLNGGFILFGKSKSGLINNLLIEESKTVSSFILGLGKTTITVNVTSAEGATAGKTVNGYILGIFIFGIT